MNAAVTVEAFSFQHLTELLSEFEAQCTGWNHTLSVKREPNSRGAFWLVYRYLVESGECRERTMLISSYDAVSIRAKHDKILEFFR